MLFYFNPQKQSMRRKNLCTYISISNNFCYEMERGQTIIFNKMFFGFKTWTPNFDMVIFLFKQNNIYVCFKCRLSTHAIFLIFFKENNILQLILVINYKTLFLSLTRSSVLSWNMWQPCTRLDICCTFWTTTICVWSLALMVGHQ